MRGPERSACREEAEGTGLARILLVLCVDAFRCLQLSHAPWYCGWFAPRAPWHEMEALEARRKVQYRPVSLDLSMGL